LVAVYAMLFGRGVCAEIERAHEDPGEVGVDHPLPVGQVDLVRLGRRAEQPRVVDQQVQPSPAVVHRVEERGHRRR
jgi:hypothetical protein